MNSKYLYLTIDLLTIAVPFAFSFYSKAPFYKKWNYVFFAILIPAIPFLIWDEIFTQQGVWGFNEHYLTGITIGHLPLEEILFFVCIPYACLFTHYALKQLIAKDHLFPHQELITSLLIVIMMVLGIFHLNLLYTSITFLSLGFFLAFHLLKLRPRYMGRFYFTYAVILIPFFIVNGILTGSFIEDEVVWYNNAENLTIRLGTIPIEDVFYGMLLILLNVTVFEWFLERERYKSFSRKS